ERHVMAPALSPITGFRSRFTPRRAPGSTSAPASVRASHRAPGRVGRFLAALASVAIAVPALAAGPAAAEPIYDTPLTAAEGTTWTEGACAPGTGVTVVVDYHGDSTPAVRCVTNEGGGAYFTDNALQTYADAGFSVLTQTTSFGPMVCQVDGEPPTNPCDAWTGVWWSLWEGTTTGGWLSSSAAVSAISAATDGFLGLSLVDNVPDAPAPRAETTLDGEATEPPATEEPPVDEGPGDP